MRNSDTHTVLHIYLCAKVDAICTRKKRNFNVGWDQTSVKLFIQFFSNSLQFNYYSDSLTNKLHKCKIAQIILIYVLLVIICEHSYKFLITMNI